MNEPTDHDLRLLAHALTEAAHFGRITATAPHPDAAFPSWRMEEARAAWHLGARYDGAGDLHGPARSLGEVRR